MEQRRPISRISALHYLKLVGRTMLLLAAVWFYIDGHRQGFPFAFSRRWIWFFRLLWVIFICEMALRFFPSSLESMGCQKQFKRNYRPTGQEPQRKHRGRLTVLLSWFALNGVIGLLYWKDFIDEGILLLISLAYSVCDMICILFFCPFQTWMMKNKCCGSCSIYNWDFAMMFTPLGFIKSGYTWTLLGLGLALLLYWEVMLRRHPERFSERSNASLACANCREKLCHHKKQLRRFLKNYKLP